MLPEATQKLLIEMLVKEEEAALEKRRMEKAAQETAKKKAKERVKQKKVEKQEKVEKMKTGQFWPHFETDKYKVLSAVQALGSGRVNEIIETLKTAGHAVQNVGSVLGNLKKDGWIGNVIPAKKEDGAIWFDLDRPSGDV